MQILITGGAGFIGSHLCEYLINTGHNVTCLDNLSSGNIQNIEKLLPETRFTFVEHDTSIPFDYPAERIYNLASPASPAWYSRNPLATIQTIVQSTFNSAAAAEKYGARILQASTSEVYGSPLVHPQTEAYWGNVNPNGERSCYAESKRFAETILSNYHRQYNTDIRIARIFNTYGPKMRHDDGRVIPNFISQALNGSPLSIHGDGNQTRSFCYIDDLITGLVQLMEESEESGPVNLGNNQETSISDLAKMIINLTGSKSDISCIEAPCEDPKKRKPDLTRARMLTGFMPKVSLEKGLQKTIHALIKQTKQ